MKKFVKLVNSLGVVVANLFFLVCVIQSLVYLSHGFYFQIKYGIFDERADLAFMGAIAWFALWVLSSSGLMLIEGFIWKTKSNFLK